MDLDDQRDYEEEEANRQEMERPDECDHPWHRASTPEHEPIEPACPQCGDRA